MTTQYKAVTVTKTAIDVEQGIYEVMASVQTVDRQGDVLEATGALLDNYLRNPVVLYGHDYGGLPVAKALEIVSVPGVGVRAKMQFPPKGVDTHIDAVHTLWDLGFLNAVSVGFTPVKGTPTGKGGTRFTEWELLEFSIVPIPANADALRLAFSPDVLKRGRVLSSKNEQALRDAVDALQAVLAQLEAPPSDDPQTESVKSDELSDEALDALDSLFKEIRNGYQS